MFPDNLVQKPDVVKLEGRTAFFQDGSQEEVDVVFLSTGELILDIYNRVENYRFLQELSC